MSKGSQYIVKSCDECILNYDDSRCLHPNAPAEIKMWDVDVGERHSLCPLDKQVLMLGTELITPSFVVPEGHTEAAKSLLAKMKKAMLGSVLELSQGELELWKQMHGI